MSGFAGLVSHPFAKIMKVQHVLEELAPLERRLTGNMGFKTVIAGGNSNLVGSSISKPPPSSMSLSSGRNSSVIQHFFHVQFIPLEFSVGRMIAFLKDIRRSLHEISVTVRSIFAISAFRKRLVQAYAFFG